MIFIEDKDPVLLRQRIIRALSHLTDLGTTIRSNNSDNPLFWDSIYLQLVDVTGNSAHIFKRDLLENVPAGSADLSTVAAAKFLELTYEVCSWVEVGMPKHPPYDSILYELVQKFRDSYPRILTNHDAVSARISDAMAGADQSFDQIPPPLPSSVDLDNVRNEPISHLHNRLYAKSILSARQGTAELAGEVKDLNSEVKTALDANKKILDEVAKSTKILDLVTKAKATEELTTHYNTFAKSNKRTYWAFFSLALASFIGAAWFGVGITLHWSGPIFPGENGLVQQDQIVAESIARIAIVAVLSGLGAFFAKQAGHNRKLYHWAESIGLQLKTFEAYVKDVSDDAQKNQLRAEFSRRVFGQEPGGDVSPSNDGTLPASLLPLITEAVRSIAKSPDKA